MGDPDVLEKLEAMGRTGGAIAATLGLALLVVAAWLAIWTVTVDPADVGRWGTGCARFLALMIGAFGVLYAMVGVRLLTRTQYPDPHENFPPMPLAEFVETVRNHQGAICVCTRCRIEVPTEFSTGACPVCTSTVDYFEVRNDEDAEMVIAAAS